MKVFFLVKMLLKLLPEASFAIRYHHIKGDIALDSWEPSSVFVTAVVQAYPCLYSFLTTTAVASVLIFTMHSTTLYRRGSGP